MKYVASFCFILMFCACAPANAQSKLFGSTSKEDVSMPLRTGIYEMKRFAPGRAFAARVDNTQVGTQLTAGTKKILLKAFGKMTCIEYNELSANYYTAELNYHPIALMQTINLPSFWGDKVNVFTDGKRLLAIDPRSGESWIAKATADVTDKTSWKKLTHIKN
jgi:hypothetical protein